MSLEGPKEYYLQDEKSFYEKTYGETLYNCFERNLREWAEELERLDHEENHPRQQD